jgi:predicted N-acyltransferase
LRQISSISPAAWNELDHGGSPFLEHGFLAALEESGSIGPGTGWDPRYLLAESAGRLCGAVAAFVKDDSYGEYIFDWGWASASQEAGIPYYPKLVVAAPFTPATGPRLLCGAGENIDALTALLAEALLDLATREGCYSVHVLFCTPAEAQRLELLGFASRASFQYHWHNRGYRDFDGFLAELTSRRRKQFRKERQRARQAIDNLIFLPGRSWGATELAEIDRYYRCNVRRHGGYDYLRPGFFHTLAARAPTRCWFARAERAGAPVAGALYLETERALYGRYWGCDESIDCLHFEVAYYAGIERAIARGLPLFEAGAQGEHKLLRGFEPSGTHSVHWFVDQALDRGVREFLRRERLAVAFRMRALAAHGPYRRSCNS